MRRSLILISVLAVALIALPACGKKSGDGTKSTATTKTSTDPKVRAVDLAKDAVKKDPDSAVAHRNLAQAYLAAASPTSGQKPPKDRDELVGKAVKELEKAVELDADNLDLLAMLGSGYMSAHDYEKASSTLGQVAAKRKGDANVWYQWGLAASNAGDTKTTVKAWEHFLDVVPAGDGRIKPTRASLESLAKAPKPAADTSDE